jgi:hypothetical protein
MSHTATCDQEDPGHSHEKEQVKREKRTPAEETKAGLKK